MALLVVVAALVPAVHAVGSWSADRALRDQVDVRGELRVRASSSTWTASGRGRVDHLVELRNTGPLAVRVVDVRSDHGPLLLQGRGPRRQVPAGGAVEVPLSVRLDCATGPLAAGSTLPATVVVVPASGRLATIASVLTGAGPLRGAARQLCAFDPDRRVSELSGPVASGRRQKPRGDGVRAR